MTNLETLVSPYQENYVGIENDVSYLSQIYNFQIVSATKLTFNFNEPQDNVQGMVVVWDSFTVDPTKTPLYSAPLPNVPGPVTVAPGDINFQQGVYTIAITAGGLNTVAATHTIINGQSAQSGMSSLIVTNKSLSSLNTVFNSPHNVMARQNITWVILYEGDKLGQGTRITHQAVASNTSSGLVTLHFPAGTLKEGQTYNVVLNPGNTIQTITAGYVFTYTLQ